MSRLTRPTMQRGFVNCGKDGVLRRLTGRLAPALAAMVLLLLAPLTGFSGQPRSSAGSPAPEAATANSMPRISKPINNL